MFFCVLLVADVLALVANSGHASATMCTLAAAMGVGGLWLLSDAISWHLPRAGVLGIALEILLFLAWWLGASVGFVLLLAPAAHDRLLHFPPVVLLAPALAFVALAAAKSRRYPKDGCSDNQADWHDAMRRGARGDSATVAAVELVIATGWTTGVHGFHLGAHVKASAGPARQLDWHGVYMAACGTSIPVSDADRQVLRTAALLALQAPLDVPDALEELSPQQRGAVLRAVRTASRRRAATRSMQPA